MEISPQDSVKKRVTGDGRRTPTRYAPLRVDIVKLLLDSPEPLSSQEIAKGLRLNPTAHPSSLLVAMTLEHGTLERYLIAGVFKYFVIYPPPEFLPLTPKQIENIILCAGIAALQLHEDVKSAARQLRRVEKVQAQYMEADA